MRLLLLTTVHPGARSSGGEVATQALVDALRAAGHAVVVLGYRRAGAAPPLAPEDVVIADRHIESSLAGPRPAGWLARAALERRPYSAAKYVSWAYRRAVARALAAHRPHLVVVDHAQVGWALAGAAPFVLVAHNVEHRLYGEQGAAGGPRAWVARREARLVREVEAGLCARAAGVWALTEADRRALAELGAGERARALALPAAQVPPGDGAAAGCDVALLGTWTWGPNAAGLRWFLDEVVPRLPPGTAVRVAGAGSEAVAGGRAGVEVLGRVPDAAAFLRGARVLAVPALEGAGVQVKTLDAIATGRPVVTTSIGLRGIDDPPPTVRAADDAAGFAAALADAVARGDEADGAAAAAWTASRAERFTAEVAAAAEAAAPPAVGYLVSRYPGVTHTFIVGEVAALRATGVRVATASVREVGEDELLSAADRAEHAATHALLPTSAGRLLRAHGAALLGAPRAYGTTLVRALRLAPSGGRARLWQVFYFAEAMLLVRWLRAEGLEHVHVHHANVAADVALLACAYGEAAAPGAGPTWSLTVHGPTELLDVAGHNLPAKVAAARDVVCISDHARSQVLAFAAPEDEAKLHTIRCGIDVAAFAPATGSPDGLDVLCVAALSRRKGHAVLLEALERLHADGLPARLTLAGDGPERERLEADARRRGLAGAVRFLGAVAHADVPALHRTADVFCLPSFAEGIPTVLMEAMACGVPVVATNVMGVAELVEDGRSGLLVPPARADALAAALARTLRDPGLREQLGVAGRAVVQERYERGRAARELRAVLARPVRPAA